MRATIAEIARRAGVSKSAVSYALNGKPGVSEETRQRIVRTAQELDWQPNTAARALAGAAVGSVGLVLNRPASLLGVEPYYMEFIAGIHEVLSERDQSLVLKVVPSAQDEIQAYRRWHASRKVDGVILTDLTDSDERPELVRALGLPAVVAARPSSPGVTGLWTDDAAAIDHAVDHLVSLGHRRLGHVTGTARYLHTQVRAAAFEAAVSRRGLPAPVTVTTDFSQEQAARATRAMLTANERPTAIIFDSDLMAVGAYGVAAQMRLKIPQDISIIGWDDSVLARSVYPPLTAVSVDVQDYGATVTRALLDLVAGLPVESAAYDGADLVVRGSTAAPR